MASASPEAVERKARRMWDVVRDAIQSTGRTLRFIAILLVLALVTWLVSAH
jgi:hypothetical protein